MLGRMTWAISAAIALLAAPVAAQDRAGEGEDVMAAMAEMFAAEPLTPEQEALLPAAQLVVDRVMPPGTMAEMMQSMFGGFLDPLMKLGTEPSANEVAKELGLEEGALELTEEQVREVAAILDPAWTERRRREMDAMKSGMAMLMNAMEPSMRAGMAQAYAATFTATELADVATFFATPSGATYARKSYALASDPRIMGAAMSAMPAMMEGLAAMDAQMKAATTDLPPRRGLGDMTVEQRRRLGELTGLDADEVKDGLARAAAARERGGESEDAAED